MRVFDNSVLHWNGQRDAYSKAECYREGRLVKQSVQRSLVLYQEAALAGDSRASHRLGEYFLQQHQKQKALSAFYAAAIRNHQETLGVLEQLSSTDREAAFLLAQVFEGKYQYTQAVHFYGQANILGHSEGLYRVAKLFDRLSSTEKQDKAREDYYRDAIKAGSKYALEELCQLSETSGKASFYIGKIYEDDLHQVDRALVFYEKASQQGYGEATHYLGDVYAQGRSNLTVDMTTACRYYLLASQQGHPTAASSLQSLAQNGDAQAQYILGHDYYRVNNNMSNAIVWCIKAEAQGHVSAANYLKGSFSADQHWIIANLYLEHDVTHEDRRWIYHCQQAANKGQPQAAFYLAQESEGKASTAHQARTFGPFYDTAAKLGNSEAKAAIDRLSCQLTHPLSFFPSPSSAGIKHAPSLSSVQRKMNHKK